MEESLNQATTSWRKTPESGKVVFTILEIMPNLFQVEEDLKKLLTYQ